MTHPTDAADSFGTLHFGEARLGDVRRTRRLVRAADVIVHHPGGTLPQKIHDPAPLDAIYRLANRKEVTHAAVLDPTDSARSKLMHRPRGPSS